MQGSHLAATMPTTHRHLTHSCSCAAQEALFSCRRISGSISTLHPTMAVLCIPCTNGGAAAWLDRPPPSGGGYPIYPTIHRVQKRFMNLQQVAQSCSHYRWWDTCKKTGDSLRDTTCTCHASVMYVSLHGSATCQHIYSYLQIHK